MSDIRLVNVVPIVNEWNDAAKKNLDEAKTLMASGNYPDYNAGVVKEGVANLVSGFADDLMKAPAVDPESLRPVAHWEKIPGSYEVCAGENGSWCVLATRCSNPECGEVNPCGLKTPFCPMCGFRMEDVPYDVD